VSLGGREARRSSLSPQQQARARVRSSTPPPKTAPTQNRKTRHPQEQQVIALIDIIGARVTRLTHERAALLDECAATAADITAQEALVAQLSAAQRSFQIASAAAVLAIYGALLQPDQVARFMVACYPYVQSLSGLHRTLLRVQEKRAAAAAAEAAVAGAQQPAAGGNGNGVQTPSPARGGRKGGAAAAAARANGSPQAGGAASAAAAAGGAAATNGGRSGGEGAAGSDGPRHGGSDTCSSTGAAPNSTAALN